jgi:hypothetical protein
MAKARSDAGAKKKLDQVSAKIAEDKVRGERRLALLRQQAQLGDERDRAVTMARRAADR